MHVVFFFSVSLGGGKCTWSFKGKGEGVEIERFEYGNSRVDA